MGDHTRHLAKELANLGNKVVILTDNQRYDLVSENCNPSILTWPSIRPVHWRDAHFLWWLIHRHHPDCIIGNFGSVNLTILAGWLSGVPCRVAWYHTLSTQVDLDAMLPKWKIALLRIRKFGVYSFATHIIANSKQAQLDATRKYRIPQKKTQVFYNSLVDPYTYLDIPTAASNKQSRIVCVGRFVHAKGQDILLRAAALLKGDLDFKIELIGGGKTKSELITLADELGISNICLFRGSIPHPQVLLSMAGSLLTVVPSRSEAFGLVNIESMSVGTPVVATRTGGMPEILRDGIDGLLFDLESVEDLAAKLRMIIEDGNLRQAMGRNCRQRFLEVFEQNASVCREARWFFETARKSWDRKTSQ